MAVIEDLTEAEAYLFSILQDESGIDLAEFTWVDEEQEDACWRAWPFQWRWWRCTDTLQIDQCSRSCGKSMSIKARANVFPFVHPGGEMVITAPEGVHLDAITDVIETAFVNTRLGTEILTGGRQSFRHKPFHANFKSGARIMGRIPQRDGRGTKGTHPVWLEQDEAQDYPTPGWIELNETLKRGAIGANTHGVWRAHGVTRGVRDHFWKFTQSDSNWTVHKYSAMWRPTWTAQEREEKIEQYGGREDPDYRRNVLGEHGDSMSPLFVLHRLMNCIDDNQESPYNQDEYVNLRINDAMLAEQEIDITQALDFPYSHTSKYSTFWVGADIGFTNHPTEVLVFAEYIPNAAERKLLEAQHKAVPPDGMTRLKLLTRINLTRIGAPEQVRAFQFIINHYKPRAFSLDKTGVGLPLFQTLQEDEDKYPLTIIKGYGFSEKVLVDFDRSIEVEEDITNEDLAKEAGIKRTTVEYATDQLRYLVDSKRFWMPWDRDLLGEFQGQTYKVVRTALDQYGKREYSLGQFHALDAARMAVLGWKQHTIEELMKTENEEPVIDIFMYPEDW